MSQHYFYLHHVGEKTEVMMGWDRPMQGFFMVISKPSDGEDCYFFSNLEQHEAFPQTLQPFLAALKTFGISLPDQMIVELQQDKDQNMGNKVITHVIRDSKYERVTGQHDEFKYSH